MTARVKCSRVLVLRRGNEITMHAGRDRWHEEVGRRRPRRTSDGCGHRFMLYTSGSTGKPKGILHTTGGYLVGTAMTARYVFDLATRTSLVHRRRRLGHGHSYRVRAAREWRDRLMYEGAPNQPDFGHSGTSSNVMASRSLHGATAIRAFSRRDAYPNGTISSLRLPARWVSRSIRGLMWYRDTIGKAAAHHRHVVANGDGAT